MDVREYVKKYLPERFGVHPAFGHIAELVLLAERAGEKTFAQNNFDSSRERAELAIPYQVNNLEERERVLNVLELLILIHRQEKHGENWNFRITELQENTIFTEEEREMIAKPMGWWSG